MSKRGKENRISKKSKSRKEKKKYRKSARKRGQITILECCKNKNKKFWQYLKNSDFVSLCETYGRVDIK